MPGRDLSLLIDAARKAGKIAAHYWDRSPRKWDKPGGHGPVTEADIEIDRMLRDTLTAARPDYGWLSEETEDGTTRLGRGSTFIVDPIDGTRSFIAGERNFAHSLAVAADGQVQAGVVFLPMLDRLYIAERGRGATLNGVPIAASTTATEAAATLLATRHALDVAHWPGGVPPVRRSFRPSLAYRLALVAQGRFDGMVGFHGCWEWDIAAGSLIASEAGAHVTDRDGAALRFNNREPLLPGIIVASEMLHSALMARRGTQEGRARR